MTYVKYNSDGSIAMSADWHFPDSEKVDFNVVRGYDGKLYKEGTEPVKSEEELEAEQKEVHRQEILSELSTIDSKKVRSASAIALALSTGNTPDSADVAILTKYEQEANALREELAGL